MRDTDTNHVMTQVRATGRIYPAGWRAHIRSVDIEDDDLVENLFNRPLRGVDGGPRLIRRERVTYDEYDLPQSWSVSWFDAALADTCPRLLVGARIVQGTARYVEECTGLVVACQVDEVAACCADAETADTLQVPVMACLLRVRTVLSTADGTVVEVGQSVRTRAGSMARYRIDVPAP